MIPDFLQTEGSDFLITEGSDFIITDQDISESPFWCAMTGLSGNSGGGEIDGQ